MSDSDRDRAAGGLFHLLRGAQKAERRYAAMARNAGSGLASERHHAYLTRIDGKLSEKRMCNRYSDEIEYRPIREEYEVRGELEGNYASTTVHPGNPGRVVTADRWLRLMHWGFPFRPKGKDGKPLMPKPVNNARTDKLRTGFWSASFRDRRCLIPMSRFAEAEGPKGSMTETWYSGERPILTAAGIWRDSAEWGKVYSMVMTESAPPVSRIHDRMPVIIAPADYATWLGGSPDEAFALCRPTEGLIEDRTAKLWYH